MSLLQEVIESLTTTERRLAVKWLAAPLHNRREDVRELFRLRAAVRTDEPLAPPEEYARIYGRKAAYSAARHRQLEHQLLKRLEAFLAWGNFRRAPYAADYHLLQSYRQRGLDDHRRTRLRRYRPGATASAERLHFDYFVAKEKYDLEMAARRGSDADAQAPEESLRRYLLALRLRQAAATLAHQRLHGKGKLSLTRELEELFREAGAPENRQDPFLHLYALATQLQIAAPGQEEITFTTFIRRLETDGHRLPAAEQRNVLLFALNYGLRSANTGYEPAIGNTFSLYRIGLDRGILHNQGVFSVFTFNNILALALRLQKTDWAADFLERYRHELPPDGGNEVEALGRARLALAKQEDGTALHHLQQADFKDFIHHLTARVMQLKIYFRQDSFTLLQSHLSSTRKLLSRKKGASYHLENYRNIFSLAQAVLRLEPGNATARQQLRDRIATTDPCTEKPWLLTLL